MNIYKEMYDLDDIEMAKGLHIAHLNIRSLINKWDVFKTQFMDKNLHVLGLSETWLNNKLPNNLFKLSNDFTLIRNDRKWSDNNSIEPKRGGGVALYIKNCLNFSDNDFSDWNTSNRDIESQWVTIKYPNSRTILIGNIYRPPQGNIDKFNQVLEEFFNKLDLRKFEILLMGDMNIDLLDKNNEAGKKLVNLIKPYGLCQFIKEPTRYSTNKNSLLDIFVTNSNFIYKSGVSNINLSDHQMILVTRKKVKTSKQKCSFIGRSYRYYKKNEFQDMITNADWSEYNKKNKVSDKWQEMLKIIHKAIDQMCPLKTFKIKQVKEPWITAPLIELIKDKDKAIKIAKKRKDDPQLWITAKRLRNNCTNRLRKARADFIKENLENNMGNSKKFWRNIQEVLPKNKNSTKDTFMLSDEDIGIIPDMDTANYINNFFAKIGPKLAQRYTNEWETNIDKTDFILEDIRTNIDEVKKLCNNININKSSSISNISSGILKDAFLAVPEILTNLFNLSFELAEIPDVWKVAKVTPLQKTGDSKNVSNLRPISLLPLPSKLIEKIVHNRIYNHCNENKLLDKKQGGFRPNYSTTSTTTFYINDIYEAMNTNEITIAVYIDAMKAFDTVNHDILCKKLEYFGIKGNNAKWVKNYLSNRKQCTFANNILSDEVRITCGVPQGSVCGPLLFLLYINDISTILKKCKVSLYADDTVIYYSAISIEEAFPVIQQDLIRLIEWCNLNKLTINCKKTKYCIYGMRSIVKKSRNIDMLLSLNGTVLEKVCSYKYLGFILDDQLNFNKHVTEISKIVSHKLYLLSRIRKYLTQNACVNIFKTMVLSLIEYGDIVYAGTSHDNLNKLAKLFYRGLRICDNSNFRISRNDLCNDCHIAPLELRRDIHLLLFMHKQIGNENLVKKTSVQTRLHQAPVFKLYKPNNEKARQNILYRGALTWNALPSVDRNKDFKTFKSKLKTDQFN